MRKNLNLQSLMGYLLVLVILFLWKITYPISCLAWVFPTLTFLAMIHGQFEYSMRFRKHRASFIFKKQSWIYFWMTRKILTMLFSILFGIPLILSLVSFTALADATDAGFILLSTIITLFLFPLVSKVLQKHTSQDMVIIMTKRVVVLLTMLIMLVIYSFISYFKISVPNYLDLSSLKNTVDMASQTVGSVCLSSNYFLKFIQELDAVGWYTMLTTNKMVESKPFNYLLWALFFVNHAFVFAALSRTQVEAMEALNKIHKKIMYKN